MLPEALASEVEFGESSFEEGAKPNANQKARFFDTFYVDAFAGSG
jgi:hypothetical protein